MKIFIKNNGHSYEAVPCGKACSYRKKDSKPDEYSRVEDLYCSKKCYCPKFWLNTIIETANAKIGKFTGLKKID